jgi:muramoyltetrapeptide carboxypeptidase LdcA involved in peptidoglycan recycling
LDSPQTAHRAHFEIISSIYKNLYLTKRFTDEKGYELLQGHGTVKGRFIGGCVDVFPMIIGTEIWPDKTRWKDSILFLETSEEYPSPNSLKYLLRGIAAQGLFDKICGIICGKPKDAKYYHDYKNVLLRVVGKEVGRYDLPILYNMNFGHTAPIQPVEAGSILHSQNLHRFP